jgi:hypothetical protein
MTRKFSELRAKMSSSARAEEQRQAELMLAESAALHTTGFVAQPADAEMAQFQADLLQSIRELKAGQFARVSQMPLTQLPITPTAQT